MQWGQPMNTKTSAHYQREYRRRLREQGLVKKEIRIRPEQADRARAFEKALRKSPDAVDPTLAAERAPWSTNALYGDLLGTALVKDGRASCELIDGAGQGGGRAEHRLWRQRRSLRFGDPSDTDSRELHDQLSRPRRQGIIDHDIEALAWFRRLSETAARLEAQHDAPRRSDSPRMFSGV